MDGSKKEVIYPPVVIAHITEDILDLVTPHLANKERVLLHYSSQPNGPPHLGTMTSLGLAFALGKRIRERTKKDVELTFEALDNSPGIKKEIRGEMYYKMLRDSVVGGQSVADANLDLFEDLMSELSSRSEIPYRVELYSDIQQQPLFRRTLLGILSREKEFVPIISPSEGYLKVRFPCPTCSFAEKSGKSTRIVETRGLEEITLESFCPEHGYYRTRLSPDPGEVLDLNTPLRSVIRKVRLIEQSKKQAGLSIMVDGSDWVGMALQLAHALDLLGYRWSEMPIRFFTPLIEDWSGAKFSKSVYVNGGAYSGVSHALMDYREFKKLLGKGGLDLLWSEVSEWSENPKKLFRNYSIEYFQRKWNLDAK